MSPRRNLATPARGNPGHDTRPVRYLSPRGRVVVTGPNPAGVAMSSIVTDRGVERYGAVSQAFHWITAGLVIALLAIGWVADVEADEPGNAAFVWHSSLGVLVFFLALARVVWRLFSPAPALPAAMRGSERVFARTVHVTLYALIFALPLSGWLVASAEGGSVSFFGIASLPQWEPAGGIAPPAVRPQAGNAKRSREQATERASGAAEQRGEFWEDVHEALAYALAALAMLHVLAALKHHVIDRDNVLRSMLPGRRRL